MKKEPLYRKVNSKAHGCHHNTGRDAKFERNSKVGMGSKMKSGVQRGLDYTPLFKFLLSKVGMEWAPVYKEAQSRLDREDPIWWMVNESTDYFRYGEKSYYNTLKISDGGILEIVNPNIRLDNLWPTCRCCTHTFNGKPFTNKWAMNKPFIDSFNN